MSIIDTASAISTPFIQKCSENKKTSGTKNIIDFKKFVIVHKYAFPITLKVVFHINNIALNIKNIAIKKL